MTGEMKVCVHERMSGMVAVAMISCALMSGVPVIAQESSCVERILVPVRANKLPGAHGSLWQTYLTVTNHGSTAVDIGGIGSCGIPPCTIAVVAPDTTIVPQVYDDYIVIGCDEAANVDISLRVIDLSRALGTWGTTIPVVRGRDVYYGGVISITGIPNTEQFRSMLRIYGVQEGTRTQVRVQIFEVTPNVEPGGALSDVLHADFDVSVAPVPSDPLHSPGRAEIQLWMIPEIQEAELIRVEITGNEGAGLWAMVSATNNDTQHVTMLLPKLPQQ